MVAYFHFSKLILTVLIAFSFFHTDILAQATKDTIWGTGNIWVREENTNTPIYNANIVFTSVDIPGDTTPDNFSYNFVTNTGGWVIDAALPIMIDVGLGTSEYHDQNNAFVYPQPASTFMIAFHGEAVDSYLTILNMNGRVVSKIKTTYFPEKDISNAIVDMQDNEEGIYIYYVNTNEGVIAGKIINSKIYGRSSKNLNIPGNVSTHSKNVQSWEAIYDVLITAEGYETYNEQETITEDFELSYKLNPLPGLPQYQYIGGYVYYESLSVVEGATVRLVDENDEIIEEMTTDSDGYYLTSAGIPTSTTFTFEVGGITGKFAYMGDEASVPEVILNAEDTIKECYCFVLYDKTRNVPNSGATVNPTGWEIKEMYIGPHSEIGIGRNILWDQMEGWTNNTQRETNRNLMSSGMNLFGLEGRYIEVFDTLNLNGINGYDVYSNPLTGEIGIHLEPGTDQCDRYTCNIQVLLGNIVVGTPASNVTVSQNTTSFYKENFGRALDIAEVTSRNSYMNPISKDPTHLDRAIVSLIVEHYENLLTTGTAYFGLNNIEDELSDR